MTPTNVLDVTQDGTGALEGSEGAERGGSVKGSMNQYLMDMSAEDRLKAASRMPASTVFEFRPKRRAVKSKGGKGAEEEGHEDDAHTVR